MKTKSPWSKRCLTVEITVVLILWAVCAAPAQQEPEEPVLVTNPPAMGTFYSGKNSAPWPFDPSFGTRPVFYWKGAYYVDDSGENQKQTSGFQSEGGGGMAMMSSGPGSPCNPCSTNGGGGGSSLAGPPAYSFTNELFLEIRAMSNSQSFLVIHRDTNSVYDVFSTTNVSPYVSGLNLTNWLWRTRTNAFQLFALTNLSPTEGWFQLGTTTNDFDSDGLTIAYESLVSHTSTNLWDTDGDRIGDGVEVQFGLNPRVTDPAFTISITQPAPNSLTP